MTNEQLLHLAGKAAGVPSRVIGAKPGLYFLYQDTDGYNGTHFQWDPLNDDSDAFCLIVKLGLPIDFDHSCGAVWVHNPWTGEVFQEPGTDDFKGDRSAFRRAVVRAAAAIGKAMP